ncbi:hypothetical protein CDAR_263001 [Caerostris darwini]|uniref:Uncharacterized protein n=1 Tax=Caerostris darwini TaxID=1538125 RepID=A0AAV4RYN5_9ARAC|nr:hypothetical protein CDAR_263001 [Caerostris darwini]
MKTKCACSKNNKRLRNVKIRKQMKAKEEHKFTPTVLFSNGPFRLKYSFLTPSLQFRVPFQFDFGVLKKVEPDFEPNAYHLWRSVETYRWRRSITRRHLLGWVDSSAEHSCRKFVRGLHSDFKEEYENDYGFCTKVVITHNKKSGVIGLQGIRTTGSSTLAKDPYRGSKEPLVEMTD